MRTFAPGFWWDSWPVLVWLWMGTDTKKALFCRALLFVRINHVFWSSRQNLDTPATTAQNYIKFL